MSRAWEVLQYRDLEDLKVSLAGIEVRTGRKWKAADAVEVKLRIPDGRQAVSVGVSYLKDLAVVGSLMHSLNSSTNYCQF